MKIDINDLEFIFKFRDDDEMPAIMTLIIGQFQIRGFPVRKSKFANDSKRFALFPPSNRTGKGGWVKIFFTEIKKDWYLLEQRALTQFDIEHSDYLTNKSIGLNNDDKEIKAEDIDFMHNTL